jgi:hypothetical protein
MPTSWRQSLADVVEVGVGADELVDLAALWGARWGTSVLTDICAIARILH